ncbi:hypothetical protein A9R05_17170 [Burkholderia sp. KK1]|nr:hypothetical protein A9R05_17170 [Burkholderia sp. KK1]
MRHFSNRNAVAWAKAMLASRNRPVSRAIFSAIQAEATVIGRRPRRIGRFDALRMCVQSLIASALTYACMNFVGSSSTTWGVFSRLFTLQVSFDRSLKYGVGQMIGAAIGTAVGLATLHFFPDAANAFPRLALATLVTCLASTLFPTTNYSIVVAASRAEAIALGAAIGIGVSLSVWPQLSRSRAFEIMGELLDDCRALLDRIGQSQCGWLTEKEREPLAECIDRVRECASGYLQALATWMRSCRLPNALSGR